MINARDYRLIGFQTVKVNKDETMRMTQQVYTLICAVINLCHDTDVELPPAMIHNMAQLSE